MGFDQYHEPASELPEEVRSFARIIASLTEEAQAIGWYQQRLAVEKDDSAGAIMRHAQEEEFLHFAMDLEWLSRHLPDWRIALQNILFREGDIVAHAERGEQKQEEHDRGTGVH